MVDAAGVPRPVSARRGALRSPCARQRAGSGQWRGV